MLSKPLLYTAMSRASKLLILVGDKRALSVAVRKGAAGRHSLLAHRLAQAVVNGPTHDTSNRMMLLYELLGIDAALSSLRM